MRVVKASYAGACYGVQRALDMAVEASASGEGASTYRASASSSANSSSLTASTISSRRVFTASKLSYDSSAMGELSFRRLVVLGREGLNLVACGIRSVRGEAVGSSVAIGGHLGVALRLRPLVLTGDDSLTSVEEG